MHGVKQDDPQLICMIFKSIPALQASLSPRIQVDDGGGRSGRCQWQDTD